MRRLTVFAFIACLIPVTAMAQSAAPATPSKLWIAAGGGFGTLHAFCQTCEEEFPFRHGGTLTGNIGRRISSRMDVGADVFWMQWRNESGRISATALTAVAQFRPWESQGFFIKGGAGMALIRNWVHTLGPNPDDQKALAVVFGGGWAFNPQGRLGLQMFATQHVGAVGDLQTNAGLVPDVTGNFWSLGAAIVIR